MILPDDAARLSEQPAGRAQVVEQKHMGSRATLIVCKSRDVARDRSGILEEEDGICYTRTERRFFEDMSLERELLKSVRERPGQSAFWRHLVPILSGGCLAVEAPSVHQVIATLEN